MNQVNEALHSLLREAGVDYRTVRHDPTPTSADSARARGEELKVGGKALVIKTGDDFRLFVLSAACSLDSAALKRHFGVKKTRFADAGELESLTGLVPGAVPPFGRPILPLELFLDPSVLANERIAFNAGLLTESIIMPVADYIRVAGPVVLEFAAPSGGR
ncbi:MAG TPA: YbaK/EbsC family protein [Pirellulales bacterium]|nr:YbaK/EbsC family protein [Pirellulales bacterium]